MNMNLTISTSISENYKDHNRYRGTYLHGILEREYGYDIFSFNQTTNFKEGIHDVTINGLECFFILWRSRMRSSISPWAGYLITKNDPDVGYCLNKYIKQSACI